MKRQEYELVPHGSLEALHASLRRVERKLQLTMVGFALSVVVLGLLGAFALGVLREALQPTVLRARTIQVVDTAGRTRIELGVGFHGPSLALYDSTGKSRLGLAVTSDGPMVALSDASEGERVSLGVPASGVPDFILSDRAGFQAILTSSTALFHKDKSILWVAP